MISRKKLIEVALPLEAINVASAREKSIRHGHPSTLHLWWARRPQAACRAVLFGSLVDDPSSWPEKFPTEEEQEEERQRLFRIIEELVTWANSNNETVMNAARTEIARSIAWNRGDEPPIGPESVKDYLYRCAPTVLDPFCGGGSIPLEAQRLGLEAHASDLNPIAVLITKALIEIPPKFAGRPPVNPESRKKLDLTGDWKGMRGLEEDVRYYGKWVRDEAWRRIGHLYPKVKQPGGKEATVIAWVWARTVKCMNPACGAQMPLVRSFRLSKKNDTETWIEPMLEAQPEGLGFEVKTGKGSAPEGTVSRRGVRCLVCGAHAPLDHVRAEGRAGRMSARLIAIVGEDEGRRVYLSPRKDQEDIAATADPQGAPDTELPEQALGFRVQGYGMTKHRELFTKRQLVALTTFSDLVSEVRQQVLADANLAGVSDDGVGLDKGGAGATAYADSLATYLAFAVDRGADYWSSLAIWAGDFVAHTFGRQTLSMIWDFAEANPFSDSTGNWENAVEWITRTIAKLPHEGRGLVVQRDAAASMTGNQILFSTDPPYYDNVSYADLSDFFYVWIRRSLHGVYPQLFSTLLVPKKQELVADPFRHGGRQQAQAFFEKGLQRAFALMRDALDPGFPLSVFYAFKQAEDQAGADNDGARAIASTGWETMLEGLMRSGFTITGTIPMRTERPGRLRDTGSNALASSILLVCRARSEDSPLATRREFLNALKGELPDALKKLQHGNIAPVDLAQAAIGPGMAVFSRYSKVVESDGSPMPVRTALQLINQALDEVLAEQETEYDRETRFAVGWFEQNGMNEGAYGVAEVLATAKATSVVGMVEAGIVVAQGGRVRLLRRNELAEDWDPATDRRLTIWEITQHLIRSLLDRGSEQDTAELLRKVGALGETARDLAYRLYTTSERKGWTQEALSYNSLVVAWPEIKRLASSPSQPEAVPLPMR